MKMEAVNASEVKTPLPRKNKSSLNNSRGPVWQGKLPKPVAISRKLCL
jgi:hypothetical protein